MKRSAGKGETDKPQQRTTIRDVAARADVSIGTVSRVISGAAFVSKDLSERVLAAADSLGYRPRGRTTSAQGQPTRLISCFVSDISNLLYGQVISAAEERLAQSGYVLIVANTGNERRREDELLSLLRQRAVHGAIISFGEESHPGLGETLRKAGVPAVILDRTAPPGFDSVQVDHRGAATDACNYLIGMGHKRVGMIIASSLILPGQERIRGYRDAHAKAGLPVNESLIRTDCITADAAFAEARRLLDAEDRPTALVTLGSQALGGTLRAVRAAGLSIPEDLSIICFGDTELARVVAPNITCIHWDRWQLGRQAVDMLMARMQHPDAEARTVILPTEIILRQSCGPAPQSGWSSRAAR